jgi:glucose/arabinose dehydrogenase
MARNFSIAAMPLMALFAMAAMAADTGTALPELRTGVAAFGDWQSDAPGVRRLIRSADLPSPLATRSAANAPRLVGMPAGALPKVPDGFEVSLFAHDLTGPRTIRVAPNGDIFVAESDGNRILAFRAADGAATPSEKSVFAEGFDYPYGIAFYPLGSDPHYVYVAQTDRVVRFPYRNGDLKARGPAETIVSGIPVGGHSTRDIAFSPDGKTLFVAVGSASNAAERMAKKAPAEIVQIEAAHGVGAAWNEEEGRAAVLAFDPDGKNGRIFAAGIRNCAGLTVREPTGDLWCATNERDGLGDNLPPDYVSRIRDGAFYGWPWYYIGANEDPRHAGERPDLAGKITVPDVLIQPHSAPLGIVFYDGTSFPEAYRGDGFATLHGSWNRADRTGYKVVRIVMKDGAPTGEYEDFMTSFVVSNNEVWGRPVGVAVAHDGALLVSEDGNGTIWRVAYKR